MKYRPGPAPADLPAAAREYLARELSRIAQALEGVDNLSLETKGAEPDRYSDGDVVYADGTSWDPGSGEGAYAREGGAWNKLGGGAFDTAADYTMTGAWTFEKTDYPIILDTPTDATVGTQEVAAPSIRIKGSMWDGSAATESWVNQQFTMGYDQSYQMQWTVRDVIGSSTSDERPGFTFLSTGNGTGYATGFKVQPMSNSGHGGHIMVNNSGMWRFLKIDGTTLSGIGFKFAGQAHPSGYTSYWVRGNYGCDIRSFFNNAVVIEGGRPTWEYGTDAGRNGGEHLNVKFDLILENYNAARTACQIRGAASQTADLQQWQDSASTVLASIDASGALSAVSYGGITEANLVDKSAAETISGAWSFAAITATSYGGITEANLVDKSAAETIAGQWVYSTGPQLADIELGHASDTTITRASAGKVEVEGKPILTHDDATLASGSVFFSTSSPTGGSDGDVWFKHEA